MLSGFYLSICCFSLDLFNGWKFIYVMSGVSCYCIELVNETPFSFTLFVGLIEKPK